MPSQSRAYTGMEVRAVQRARVLKLRKKKPRPAPYPWRRTVGAGDEGVLVLNGAAEFVGVMEKVLM